MFSEELRAELLQLQQEGRSRQISETLRGNAQATSFRGRAVVDFTSWDLLGLSRHPQVIKSLYRSLTASGVSSCAARTSTGTYLEHNALEHRLARFFRTEAALIFSSRSQAVLSLVAAIVNERDLLIVDELYQGPVVDAGYLVGAQVEVVSLRNHVYLAEVLAKARSRRRVVLFADYLSPVLGECLALEEVLPLLSAHNALMVLDESAALGNVGALGAGSSEILATNTLLNAAPLVARIADLSLTLCSYGGSIVCSGALRELVIQRSRAIGSESSLPPALAAAAERSLDLVELMPLARVCIGSLAERMRAGLRILNCSVFPSQSPIVSFEVQSLRIAREVVEALFRKGFLFELVQLSTSLRSRSVIRALISNAHSDDTISKALQALDEVLGRLSMDARRQA